MTYYQVTAVLIVIGSLALWWLLGRMWRTTNPIKESETYKKISVLLQDEDAWTACNFYLCSLHGIARYDRFIDRYELIIHGVIVNEKGVLPYREDLHIQIALKELFAKKRAQAVEKALGTKGVCDE